MTIQKVEARDAKLVSDIIGKSFEEQARILQMNEQQYPYYVAFEKPEAVIKAMENGEAVCLLMDSERAIGTIRCNVDNNDSTKGYINRLAVLPQYRKNGYGKLLMDFAEDMLKKCGVMDIEISIVRQFDRLQVFYEMLGYAVTKDVTYSFFPFECRYMEKRTDR